MLGVTFLSANSYPHENMKLNCLKTNKNEAMYFCEQIIVCLKVFVRLKKFKVYARKTISSR